MKVRTGFVSNSSSSSFLIYGVFFEEKDLSKEMLQDLEDSGGLEGQPFDVRKPYEDGWYMGRSWDTICDDETGAQFKQSVQERVDKFFGKHMPCCIYKEAWYNG